MFGLIFDKEAGQVFITLESYAVDDDGKILVTPSLMSAREIDQDINSMIKELERLRKRAKSRLESVGAVVRN